MNATAGEKETRRAQRLESFRMHDGMHLGAPVLRVRDLESLLGFYENDFGLEVNGRYRDPSNDLQTLELGFRTRPKDSEPILVLKHDPNAIEPRHGFAGLYHYAVLVPDRKSLATTYVAIGSSGASYEGFADHTVSESLYLHDAERNGIEIYADRPRDKWGPFLAFMKRGMAGDPRDFMTMNKPLDFDSLLGEMSKKGDRTDPVPFPRGARIGHMHLRVTNLERSVEFYHEKLGLDIIGNLPAIGAAFLSAGGYHHHLGLNTWHSLGGSSHREGEAGLEQMNVVVPDDSVLESIASQFPRASESSGRLEILDPDGIRIVVKTARLKTVG
jgi:catechol 2,3-dioxygenase